jgi:hypothetical protein
MAYAYHGAAPKASGIHCTPSFLPIDLIDFYETEIIFIYDDAHAVA